MRTTLPGDIRYDTKPTGRRLTLSSTLFRKICRVILAEAQQDPRVHLSLQSTVPTSDIQATLVESQYRRLDDILAPMNRNVHESRLKVKPTEATNRTKALLLHQICQSVGEYMQDLPTANMASMICRRDFATLLLDTIDRVMQTDTEPRARDDAEDESLFDLLIAEAPLAQAFALEALGELSDAFANDEELRWRASQSIRALSRMRTPREYVAALERIVGLA
ncbi:hypothetical protein ANO11243_044810 [Dothideomycetidae sp. 11243]|nr:hypothetical protein ANO11243_044810 [fungal sp. No.11243]